MIWSREECIASVQAFHGKHGYQPVSSEAGKHHSLPSFGVAVRIFGSWNAMVTAAGFTPYPARSSANAKTRAFRDRNPNWRETLFAGVKRTTA